MASHLKPGSWFELAELGVVAYSDDDSIPKDWPPARALEVVKEGLEKINRVVPTAKWLETLLIDGGFLDVTVSHALKDYVSRALELTFWQVETFKQPLMPWPKAKHLKQAGALMSLQSDSMYHAYCMSILTRIHGWSSEDADAFCKKAEAVHHVKNPGVHAYTHL